MKRLTTVQLEAMRAVRDGADVWSPALARALRQIEQITPRLVDIGQPRAREYDGSGAVPYFGAILTKAGRMAVDSDGVIPTWLNDLTAIDETLAIACGDLTNARRARQHGDNLQALRCLQVAASYVQTAKTIIASLERKAAA
jgi:hypothetical protein